MVACYEQKKLHQEDACQALNIYPSEKYRISFAQVAQAVSLYTATPVIQIGELLKLGRDKKFTEQHFLEFGESHHVPAKVTRQHLQSIVDGISLALTKLSDIGFDTKKTRHLAQEIQDRLAGLH